MGLPGWNDVKNYVKGSINKSLTNFSTIITTELKGVLHPITSALGQIKSYLKVSLRDSKHYIDKKLKMASESFNNLVDWISGSAINHFNNFKTKFDDLSEWVIVGMKETWNKTTEGFKILGDSVINGIKSLLDKIKSALLDFADYLVEKLEKVWELSEEKMNNLMDFMQNYAKKLEKKATDDILKKFKLDMI